MSKSVEGNSNWCCWPFSLCCGETSLPPERQPLNGHYEPTGGGETRPRSITPPLSQTMNEGGDTKTGKSPEEVIKTGKSPGGTPTRTTTVQEQRTIVSTDEFV